MIPAMLTLSFEPQSVALWRLGPSNLFDKNHPSGHYILDTTNPTHEAMAKK